MAYDARLHTTINKPIGISGKSLDSRSMFYDEEDGYRDYNSTAEVLSYLASSSNRKGHFDIYINDGTGLKTYWFKDGTTNADLVEKSSSSQPEQLDFTTAIPFTYSSAVIEQHDITGALTFTKVTAGATDGCTAMISLIANGTNTPNFSAFEKMNSSKDWVNTDGVENVVVFLYLAGTYWYGIFQQTGLGGATPTQLSTPTGLSANATSSSVIDLSWSQVTNNSGYKVYRATSNSFGSASLIATKSTGTNSHTDTGRSASTTYYYWVVAVGNGTTYSDSSESSSANDTTDASGGGDVTAPTVTSATAIDATHIRIVFSEPTDIVTQAGWSFSNGSALTIASLSQINSTTWEFTFSETMTSGQTITRSYNSGTGNTIDSSSNELVSFTNASVTNSISGGGGGSAENIVWGNLQNATDVGSGHLSSTGSTPSGGIATKTLAKANGNYVEFVLPAGPSDSDGAVLALSDNNTANYAWGSITVIAEVNAYAGNVKTVAGSSAGTPTDLMASAAGQVLRLEISGDDVLIKVNGVLKHTHSGVLSGVTTIYVKGILAIGGASYMLGAKGVGLV